MSHTDADRPPRAARPAAAHQQGVTLLPAGGAGPSTLSRAKAELVLLALHVAQSTARVRPEARKTVTRLDLVDVVERVLESLVRWWCGM